MAFARQRQLCYSTLLRWSRHQPEPKARGLPAAPGFIPIQIEPGGCDSDYVLSWAEGRSLRIPPGFNAQALRQLLDVLEERK